MKLFGMQVGTSAMQKAWQASLVYIRCMKLSTLVLAQNFGTRGESWISDKGQNSREGLPEVGTAISPCKECTLLLCKIAFSSSLEAMCLLSMFVVFNSKNNHFMFQCSCHMVHLNCQTLAGLSWCIIHAKSALKYENKLLNCVESCLCLITDPTVNQLKLWISWPTRLLLSCDTGSWIYPVFCPEYVCPDSS
jgi:hypothetical protein